MQATSASLRPAIKGRRRDRKERGQQYLDRGVKRGQLGKLHYRPDLESHCSNRFCSPIRDCSVEPVTKRELCIRAREYSRPSKYHRGRRQTPGRRFPGWMAGGRMEQKHGWSWLVMVEGASWRGGWAEETPRISSPLRCSCTRATNVVCRGWRGVSGLMKWCEATTYRQEWHVAAARMLDSALLWRRSLGR